MTQEILRAIRKKKRIWRTVRGGQITEEYREAEKKVRNLIRKEFLIRNWLLEEGAATALSLRTSSTRHRADHLLDH
jgi:fructose-1,6-bisphosphatase/inositol monophosphatase family enzyme